MGVVIDLADERRKRRPPAPVVGILSTASNVDASGPLELGDVLRTWVHVAAPHGIGWDTSSGCYEQPFGVVQPTDSPR